MSNDGTFSIAIVNGKAVSGKTDLQTAKQIVRDHASIAKEGGNDFTAQVDRYVPFADLPGASVESHHWNASTEDFEAE